MKSVAAAIVVAVATAAVVIWFTCSWPEAVRTPGETVRIKATMGAKTPEALSKYMAHRKLPSDESYERFREWLKEGEVFPLAPKEVTVVERREDRALIRLPNAEEWWISDEAIEEIPPYTADEISSKANGLIGRKVTIRGRITNLSREHQGTLFVVIDSNTHCECSDELTPAVGDLITVEGYCDGDSGGKVWLRRCKVN
jgi:hypothetical protein